MTTPTLRQHSAKLCIKAAVHVMHCNGLWQTLCALLMEQRMSQLAAACLGCVVTMSCRDRTAISLQCLC